MNTPRHATPAEQGRSLDAMIDRAAATSMKTVSIEDDVELRQLVAHCLKPGEMLGEFTSRTGLGKGTILDQQMTPAQIKVFCDRADERLAQDPAAQGAAWSRKVEIPKHFTL